MISFACPGCGKQLNVTDAAAGRSGKCPACKAGVVVPAAPAPPQEAGPPPPDDIPMASLVDPAGLPEAMAADEPILEVIEEPQQVVRQPPLIQVGRDGPSSYRTAKPIFSPLRILGFFLAGIGFVILMRGCARGGFPLAGGGSGYEAGQNMGMFIGLILLIVGMVLIVIG